MGYVEIDVRRTADRVMVLLHDAKVDRTTDGTGYLNQLDSSVVDTLDAGSGFGPEFAGERVPRLEPFLRWIDHRIKVYFDVKDAEACRDRNLEIRVYEPLPDRDAFARILEFGADKVNLNEGDVFMEVRREKSATGAAAGAE